MSKLGENIAKFRKDAKLSQSDLAGKLFVTPQAVSRWERGMTEPDVETLKNISSILKVDLEQLVDGQKQSPVSQFNKGAHAFYLYGSALMTLFSAVLITSLFWKAPLILVVVYLVFVTVYLMGILVIEITKNRLLKLSKK